MMDSCWPENLPSDWRKVVEELVRGRDFANQLKALLSDHHDRSSSIAEDDDVPIDDLVMKIWNSFDNSLSILNRDDSDHVSQFPAATNVGSPCWDSCRKSEDSGDSGKSISTMKERRGCYKRRKSSHSWTKETSELVEDGHQWRKYGQKVILNARFPRNYFRCTHKYDQGCQATKQVQQIEEDRPIYRTTYYGNHTCKNLLLKASHQLIFESPESNDNSILLSFNSNITSKQDSQRLASFSSSIKKECEDEQLQDDNKANITSINNQSSSSDYDIWPANELSTFDQAYAISGINSSSCTTSDHSFDMEMIVDSIDCHFDADDVGGGVFHV